MGTVANVRSGPGTLLYAATGTATPNLESDADATFTVANWTTASYTVAGYTEDGITMEIGTEVFQHEVNEELGPIGGTVSKLSGKISFTLAESDADALALALNSGTKTTVAAGASQAGLDKYIMSNTNSLSYKTFVLLSTSGAGKSDLWIAWKCAPNGTISPAFKKGDKTMVTCTFDMYCDPAETGEEYFFSRREYTANPTS